MQLHRAFCAELGHETAGLGSWQIALFRESQSAGRANDTALKEIHGRRTNEPKPGAQKPEVKPRSATKLSFKEAHALKVLPDRIAALEREIADLKSALSAGDLFTRDPKAFQAKATALEDAEKSLAMTEDEWLAAEMRRQDLEGG